jgi:hypothetical protein
MSLKETEQTQAVNTQKEFIGWLKDVHEVSVNPVLSMEQKRKVLGDKLNNLSEDAYILYFPQIMQIIQNKKEQCAEYKNSEAQVDNILSWLTRLQDSRELVLLYIQERRKKYKLAV